MTGITYQHVKDLETFRGQAALYKLSEAIPYGDEGLSGKQPTTDHVIVSAVTVPNMGGYLDLDGGAETYIFPADKNGEIEDWGELDGSFRGGLDHEKALTGAGWSKLVPAD